MPKYNCQCFIDAFARAFDLEKTTLIEFLGHDGKEIIDSTLEEPFCYRGVHWQEFVDIGEKINKPVVAIELHPMLLTKTKTINIYASHLAEERFSNYIQTTSGVLYVAVKGFNWHHALFVDNGMITDLDTGKSFTYNNIHLAFTPFVYFKVTSNAQTKPAGEFNSCIKNGRPSCKK